MLAIARGLMAKPQDSASSTSRRWVSRRLSCMKCARSFCRCATGSARRCCLWSRTRRWRLRSPIAATSCRTAGLSPRAPSKSCEVSTWCARRISATVRVGRVRRAARQGPYHDGHSHTRPPRRAAAPGSPTRTLGRAPNLPSQLARMISDEIVGGRFKAGERLPTERELAETFGVSRNVVREAIARLAFEGTVEPRQGSGVFVLGTNPIAALRLDAEMLRDRSLFANLFELRSILEGEAASLAAARPGRKHLAAIKAALKRLRRQSGNAAVGRG